MSLLQWLSNARIGIKLGISAGLGVVLAGGMIVSEQLSGSSISRLNTTAAHQQQIVQDSMATKTAVREMQLVVRDMRLARSADEIKGTPPRLREAATAATQHVDNALKLVI